MDLVIMAAGMGSRFGGLKQLQPVDDDNNFIIDYSIFDAIRVGFDHVVFIIKEELYEDFKSTVGNRIEKFIDVDYVFQNTDNVPECFVIPEDRKKPLGTGHAILCAKPAIRSDFAVINADDFYGKDAFEVIAKYLKGNKNEDKYGIVAYHAINIIGENESAKRGVCIVENGKIVDIEESIIQRTQKDYLLVTPIEPEDAPTRQMDFKHPVSMNLFAFPKKFVNYLDEYFIKFLNENKEDLSKCEFFLPALLGDLIKENKATVDVLSTTAQWYGITYRTDLEVVKEAIATLKQNNEYPQHLWNK